MKRAGFFVLLLAALGLVAAVFSQSTVYLPVVVRDAPLNTRLPPGPTPTPVATTDPPAVKVQSNHSTYETDLHLVVVGEVYNFTAAPVENIEIWVELLDANEAVLASDYSYTLRKTVFPGEKACFKVFLDKLETWSSYRFAEPLYDASTETPQQLTVLNDVGEYDAAEGELRVVGQVRNDDPRRLEFVSVIGALYGPVGEVLDCDFTPVESVDLDPGQVSAFLLYLDNAAGYAGYELQVEGSPVAGD